MSSSSKGNSNEEWTNQIFFDHEADVPKERGYEISDEDLIQKMNDLIEGEENIIRVFVCNCPIWGWQLTNMLFSHEFVVLETTKWWWSIEKNTEGITIQRSKNPKYVRDRYRQENRPWPIHEKKVQRGKNNMKNLIRFLYEKDELHRRYNLLYNNCQHFAERIYNEIKSEDFFINVSFHLLKFLLFKVSFKER